MIHRFDDAPGLFLVDLDQDLEGQRRFISCWVWRTPELAFVVDPGPPATATRLLDALDGLGVGRLDLVLLTHIHLDHGGATARVLERFPEARVVCHPRGRPHLADPARLWAGSLAVLREKARVYGEPAPVPADALADETAAADRGVQVVATPGHAPHHVCFVHGPRLFVGEAAGTFSTLGRGCATAEPYLRPATPPVFRKDVAQASLDRLLALVPAPRELLFAHHGRACGDVRRLLRAARDQLDLWTGVVAEVAGERGLPADGDPDPAFVDAVTERVAARDAHYARVAQLPADIRARERDFTGQTLRGMVGALREG